MWSVDGNIGMRGSRKAFEGTLVTTHPVCCFSTLQPLSRPILTRIIILTRIMTPVIVNAMDMKQKGGNTRELRLEADKATRSRLSV